MHTRQTGFQPHVYFIFDKIVDICSNILESKIKGLLNRKNLVGIKTWQAAFDCFFFHLAFPTNESVIWAAAGAHDGIANV